MKDDKNKREEQASAPAENLKKNSRQDRLKLALRENIKRRKSQAKGRGDTGAASSDAADASPHDASDDKPNN